MEGGFRNRVRESLPLSSSGAIRRTRRSQLLRRLSPIPLAVTIALLATSTSSATSPPTIPDAPYRTTSYETNFASELRAVDGTYYGQASEVALNAQTSTAARNIQSGLWRMRVAAGELPALSSLNTLVLGATAFAVGWKIGRALDTKFLHFSGDAGSFLGEVVTVTGARWAYNSSGVSCNHTGDGSSYTCVPGPVWLLQYTGVGASPTSALRTSVTPGSDGAIIPSFTPGCAAGDYNASTGNYTTTNAATANACNDGVHAWPYFMVTAQKALAQTAGVGTYVVTKVGRWCTGDTTYTGASCLAKYITTAQMEALMRVDTFKDWASTDTVTQTTTSFADSAPSTAAKTAARDSLDAENTNDPRDFINNNLQPGYTEDPTLVTIPDCHGLTYQGCIDALQNAGLIGNITNSTLSDANTDLGTCAGCAVRTAPASGQRIQPGVGVLIYLNPSVLPIELPAPGANEVYNDYIERVRTLGWTGVATRVDLTPETASPDYGPDAVPRTAPTTGTRVRPDAPVTFYVNPPTVPPVSGGGGSGECCPTNSLDLGPLSGIDYGAKFPFGIFGYAAAVIGAFNVSPSAPQFNFAFPSIGGHALANGGAYNVSLNGFSSYMATIRTIISICLWIGAVWYIGAKYLRIDAAGDPGEAIDEALP